jgi:hypothetical protein
MIKFQILFFYSVLRANLNVHVVSTSVSPGNPALLRCQVNRMAREYTEIKEWSRDGVKIAANDLGKARPRGKSFPYKEEFNFPGERGRVHIQFSCLVLLFSQLPSRASQRRRHRLRTFLFLL